MPWLFPTLGWLLAASGALLVARALFRDRARGRKRCPKCWYDMSGSAGLVCPECGKDAERGKRLLKTRRRWRLAAIGVLPLAAAYFVAVTPRIAVRGWVGAVPTTALIVCAPRQHAPLAPGSLRALMRDELEVRWATDAMWDWQMVRYVAIVAAAHPRDLGTVVTREAWPEGVPIWAHVSAPRWIWTIGLPNKTTLRASVIRNDTSDAHDETQALSWDLFTDSRPKSMGGDPRPGLFGPSSGPLEDQVLVATNSRVGERPTIAITIHDTDWSREPARERVLWRGRLRLDTDIRPRDDQLIEPTASQAIETVFLRAPCAEIYSCVGRGFLTGRIRVDKFDLDAAIEASGVEVIALRVILLCGDEEVGRGGIFYRPIGLARTGQQPRTLQTLLFRIKTSVQRGEQGLGDPHCWRILMQSDPSLALRDFHAKRYWECSLELPVNKAACPHGVTWN